MLQNGHYLVSGQSQQGSAGWLTVTWVDGNAGMTGVVSESNSMAASQSSVVNDSSTYRPRIIELTNGNYVVAIPNWFSANWSSLAPESRHRGAVVWADGSRSFAGVVSEANALVGTNSPLFLSDIKPLTNGHYVVRSSEWKNEAGLEVGAVTWGNGWGGTIGVVNAGNSLIGSSAGDTLDAC